jgi:hypothetical protein
MTTIADVSSESKAFKIRDSPKYLTILVDELSVVGLSG